MAADRIDAGFAKELVESEQASIAFDGPHDMSRWDVRDRRGSVLIEKWRFEAQDAVEAPASDMDTISAADESYVIVAVRRGSRVFPMSVGFALKDGDLATVAVHSVDVDEAHEHLAGLGWLPADEEPVESEEGVAQASAT